MALAYVFTVSAKDAEEEKIKEVIKIYNHTVIQASKSRSLPDIVTFKNMMSDIAVGRIAEKLYIWVMSWHESNLFMDAKLIDIKYVDISIKDKTATVFTDERWTYKYIDAAQGTVAHPETEIRYRMRYDLIKDKDKWLIKKIKIISQTERRLDNKEGRR